MIELNISMTRQDDGYMVENAGVYFKIGQREGQILEKLCNKVPVDTILAEEKITQEQLDQFLESLRGMEVIGAQKKRRNNPLFFRIPLFEADAMFTAIVAMIRKHKGLIKVLALLSVFTALTGCVLMGMQLGEIFDRSVLRLSVTEYIVLYVTFLGTVCLHEFAHGTVCKYVGGKVGTLGFMLIFFSPAMYCDISGIRMISDKKKQILASCAGICVNLVFMAMASIAYTIWARPLFAAFIIMSFTTIVSNLIPVIRLDGYWILSFATGITNLYKKSLRGVGKLFGHATRQERFIAAYGVVTYLVIAVALSSVFASAAKALRYMVRLLA